MRIRPLRVLGWLGLLIGALLVLLVVAAWWLVTPERIRTALEVQATRAIGLPTRIERLSVKWFPRVALRLENVRIGEPAQLTAGELDVAAGLRGLLSRRVDEAELTVRNSRLDLPSLLQIMARLTRAAPDAQPTDGSAAFAIGSVRTISLEDVTLVAGPHEIVASAAGRLDPEALTVRWLHARSTGTDLEASGTITFGPPAVARFEATATELDMNRLLAFASATTAGASESAPGGTDSGSQAAPTQFDLTVKARRAVLGTMALTDLSTHLVMKGTDASLDPLAAHVFDGALAGRLTYAGAGPEVRVNGSLAGADITTLLRWMGTQGDPVTGSLNATVDIGARQSMPTPDAWRGSARLTMSNGVIRGLSVIRSSIVSLAGRTTTGNVEGSDRYDRVTGSFALEGRRIRATDLRLASPDMDLRGEGTIGMPDGALAIRADCILSRQLSSEAGRDLYRYAREGDRIVIPITIGGVLGNPSVTPRSGEIMERAIRRKIEDEAGSLMDRLLKRKR